MITINQVKKEDIQTFIKMLTHYIEVLDISAAESEETTIRKSIAQNLLKDCYKKRQTLKFKQIFLWQLHTHQAIVFVNAILAYKPFASLDQKITMNQLLLVIKKQTKLTYEKAS